MTKRDDFTGATKDLLAQRVGYRCSNPNCRILTSGPGDAPAGTTNVGVAAHVTAAAVGGPRFDNTLSATERRAPENGIWLCQVHAKLIDDAPSRFTADLLRAWKRHSEEAARMEIEELDKEFPQKQIADIAALKVYATAFDRNAFKDSFRGEVCMSAFDQAIKDTVLTIATGILRDRDGRILRQTLGRQELHHRAWRDKLGIVLELLNVIVRRFELAVSSNQLRVHGRGQATETYEILDPALADWMNVTRGDVLRIFSGILAEAGLDPLPVPHFRRFPIDF